MAFIFLAHRPLAWFFQRRLMPLPLPCWLASASLPLSGLCSNQKAYNTSPFDSALVYSFIFLVTVTYLYYEAILVASHPGEARWAWLSQFIVSKLGLANLSPAALGLNLKISYWLHTLAVFLSSLMCLTLNIYICSPDRLISF